MRWLLWKAAEMPAILRGQRMPGHRHTFPIYPHHRWSGLCEMSHSKQSGRHISGPTQSLSLAPAPLRLPVSGRGAEEPRSSPYRNPHQPSAPWIMQISCGQLNAKAVELGKNQTKSIDVQIFLSIRKQFSPIEMEPAFWFVRQWQAGGNGCCLSGNVVLSWQPTPKLCRFVLA